jgi:hypothetical protein
LPGYINRHSGALRLKEIMIYENIKIVIIGKYFLFKMFNACFVQVSIRQCRKAFKKVDSGASLIWFDSWLWHLTVL